MPDYSPDESFALAQDKSDPLRSYRDEFHIPRRDGNEIIYFAGNSLGLMPKKARQIVDQELDDWQNLAVEAHFTGKTPWYTYHEVFRETGARLVGAKPGEVVMMNSLTINLHLLFVSFFRPTRDRYKILIEEPCFPSDNYAVRTHLKTRGLDANDALLIAKPRSGQHTVRTEDVEAMLDRHGREIALVWIGGVNFLTGQVFDMPRITAAARNHGCTVGWDLAHGAGNVITQLHDWDVDFAAWCSYKYLNSCAGAIAGAFVHEKHGKTRRSRATPAGGATIRRRGSSCSFVLSFSRAKERTAGRSATRRSCRWRRCRRRCSCSTARRCQSCARSRLS